MKAKKIIIAIMCLNLCLTAIACGNKKDNSDKENTSYSSEAADDETKNSEGESSEEISETKNDADYNVVKKYWKANIPDTLEEDTENAYESDSYTENTFKALNSDGEEERSIEIYVNSEDAMSYRKNIISYGIKLEDYAEGNVDTVTLGGVDFVKANHEYWGEKSTVYMTRYEGSQNSVTITITGDADSDDIRSVLNTIEFTIPDGTETDAPYPWDGEPLITKSGTVNVGSYKLTANQIVASESILPNDIFDNRVVIAGDTMYALSDQHLYILKLNGSEAELKENVELEGDYGFMSADENGNVYISGFMEPLLVYRDGKSADAPKIEDKFAISRDGSFGVEYFVHPEEINKVTLKDDGTVERENLPIGTEYVSLVNDLFITKDYILISGSATDESGHKIFVFDHNGKYIRTLAGEDNGTLGSVNGSVQTDNGILAIDGNMRCISLWDNDGNYIGDAEDGELFGTNYPWISGLYQTNDGKIFISMVEEREDKSWDEMIMFQLDCNF